MNKEQIMENIERYANEKALEIAKERIEAAANERVALSGETLIRSWVFSGKQTLYTVYETGLCIDGERCYALISETKKTGKKIVRYGNKDSIDWCMISAGQHLLTKKLKEEEK